MIEIPPIEWSVVLQLCIVFAGATALLMVDLFIPDGRRRVTGYLALGVLAVAAIAGITLWGRSATTLSNMIQIDNFSLALNWIFMLGAAITIILSFDYLPRHEIERGEYYVIILFATGGMMLLAQGADLVVLFLGLELLSIALYVLAGFAKPRATSEEAAMKYLLIGAFATGFLVFGIALVYGATGATNLAAISAHLAETALDTERQIYLLAGAAMTIVGLSYKISMAPFHMWTPDVYEGSPTPVTAFMSVASKAAAFAGMTRFLLTALETQREVWVPAIATLAAITLVVGNIGALTQGNVKRMLAYSSIGQAGYILFGPLASSERGTEAMLYYLLAYTLTNLAAFGVLIALEARGEAAWDITDLGGLWQRNPGLGLAMAAAMLSLAGVPPTAGFVAKFAVFTAAWEAGLAVLVLIGVIVSAIGAFYYLRIVAQIFMSAPAREVEISSDRVLAFGIGAAAIAIVVIGILPARLLNLI
jgi:NADH-quinone oxidoreductase subunit N